jgi:hypothetical protein
VPGAEVKATQTATGLVRTVTSGADGSYVLPNLPIGPYQLEVSKEGFSKYLQAGIVLQVDSNPTIDAALKVGSVSEQVTVQADAAMVETHSTGVGQVVDQERVVDLPLNGREANYLIFLAGAATLAPSSDLNSTKNYPTVVITVAGGLSNGMTFLLDGATHNDPYNNQGLPLPFPDALQEFKVETSALPAQYGQHSAAAVNAVTKSGGNEFHGDAFEFFRNGDVNARDFFAPTRDTLKRNQFGGTFGGPVKKNKLFFFLGYEGTIQRSDPSTGIAFVPTPAMLTGDLTAITSPACNGGRQITLKAPYINNQIAPSLIAQPVFSIMKYYPVPTGPCGQVSFGSLTNSDEHLGLARVDYQFSDKQSMFVRYYAAHLFQPSPYNNMDLLSLTNAGVDDMVNSFVFGDTYLIGSGAVSSFRATLNRGAVTKFQDPFFSPQDIGINVVSAIPKYTLMNITNEFYTALNTAPPGSIKTTTGQIAEDVSMVKGSHQIGFGANWIHPIEDATINLYSAGQFTFSGQATGLSMADFLIGSVGTFIQSNPALAYQRQQYIGLYVQDSWRVKPRLTVNYGVRWEPNLGTSVKDGWVTHFDMADFNAGVHSTVYPNAPAGLLFPGDAGFPGNNQPSHTPVADFAPRLGLVWDPKGDGRMTVRASYGIFYDLSHIFEDYQYAFNGPWGNNVTLTNPPGGMVNPWLNYPGGNPFPANLSANSPFTSAGSYMTAPSNIKTTYTGAWNLSVQRQVGKNWLISANYLGNNIVHLISGQALNPAIYLPGATCVINGVTYTPCSSTANTQQRRFLSSLNPAQGAFYGTVGQLDDGGTGNYNGLLLSAQRRLANGVTALANYTWSHCIADAASTELSASGSYSQPSNRRADRGNCLASDRRQVLNVSLVAQSPRFSDRRLQMVAGGWQVSAIISAQTGSYFSVTSGVDAALTGIATNQRPNQVLADPYPTNQSINQWINPAAFGSAAAGTYGNLGFDNILGPGAFQLDMSLSRFFQIREKQKLEVRWEAFNVPNHMNPNIPVSTALNSGSFGKITNDISPSVGQGTIAGAAGPGDPRIMQFALKYIF